MPKWKHTQAMSAASFPAAQDLNGMQETWRVVGGSKDGMLIEEYRAALAQWLDAQGMRILEEIQPHRPDPLLDQPLNGPDNPDDGRPPRRGCLTARVEGGFFGQAWLRFANRPLCGAPSIRSANVAIRVGTMKFVERRADGSNGRLIRGDRHMVSAGHSAAATAALLVLEAGGNAVDAGVAAGLVLGVTQCDIVNVAGVAPIMIRDGRTAVS
jgi:hypothetical protein